MEAYWQSNLTSAKIRNIYERNIYLIRNENIYTDKHDIANQFNQHFINVGANLANKLNMSSTSPTVYIQIHLYQVLLCQL